MSTHRTVLGDCLIIPSLVPKLYPQFDVVVTDPPYHTQSTRRDSKGSSYEDKWRSLGAYVEYMKDRAAVVWAALKPGGCLFWMCDPNNGSHALKVGLDSVFGEKNFRREIVWRIGWISGYKTKGFIPRNHDTILFYSKGKPAAFTPLRGWSSKGHLSKWYPKHKTSIVDDVWLDIDSLGIKSFVRTDYPSQKPVELFKRCLQFSGGSGAWALDPFAGSGTLAIAANQLGLSSVSIDISLEAIRCCHRRFARENIPTARRL